MPDIRALNDAIDVVESMSRDPGIRGMIRQSTRGLPFGLTAMKQAWLREDKRV